MNGMGDIYLYNELQDSHNNKFSANELDSMAEQIDSYLQELAAYNQTSAGAEILRKYDQSKKEIRIAIGGSFSRNVRNWMNRKNAPESRSALLELCYQYGINMEEEINDLLSGFNMPPLHWLDPYDVLAFYVLQNGLSAESARELSMKCKSIVEKAAQQFTKVPPSEAALKTTGMITAEAYQSYHSITSEEELLQWIETLAKDEFSGIRKTAWIYLQDILDENGLLKQKLSTSADGKKKHAALIKCLALLDDTVENYDINYSADIYQGIDAISDLTSQRIRHSDKSIYQSILKTLGRNFGDQITVKQLSNRTKPISRGIFLLILFHSYDDLMDRLDYDYQKIEANFNNDLLKVSYMKLSPDSFLLDRIIKDCIDAVHDDDTLFEIGPFLLMMEFINFLQDTQSRLEK